MIAPRTPPMMPRFAELLRRRAARAEALAVIFSHVAFDLLWDGKSDTSGGRIFICNTLQDMIDRGISPNTHGAAMAIISASLGTHSTLGTWLEEHAPVRAPTRRAEIVAIQARRRAWLLELSAHYQRLSERYRTAHLQLTEG